MGGREIEDNKRDDKREVTREEVVAHFCSRNLLGLSLKGGISVVLPKTLYLTEAFSAWMRLPLLC